MGKALLAIIAFVVGALAGGFGGASLGGGAMMGAGAAVGLTAGACSTIIAAEELGFVTPEEADAVLAQAASNAAAAVGETPQGNISGGLANCRSAMDQIQDAGN